MARLRILTDTWSPSMGAATPIASSGNLILTQLPVGARAVALSGVAANCTVSGTNPRTVTVAGTELAVVAFAVTCTPPTSSTGTLRLTIATTGADVDPTGYLVSIDGGSGQPVSVNTTVTIAGLPSGNHSITLGDVTPNCTVAENPRTVSIPANGETTLSFTVACVPATGMIATSAATTGAAIDPDGYIARINGGPGKPLPANGTVTRGGLAPGSHTSHLDNVAPNCQVQGDNPRAVLVAGNETTAVLFQVICAATTADLRIEIVGLPSGSSADVAVAGPDGFTAAISATATINNLMPGEYNVQARDVTFGGTTYRPATTDQIVSLAAGAFLL